MIAVLCLDDRNGMLFNRRRQSRDRVVTAQILEMSSQSRLWIHPFSAPLFKDADAPQLLTDENFLRLAAKGDYCFIENVPLKDWEERLERLVIFRWNRLYPADFRLDLSLADWKKTEEAEFAGFSHEKITREVYER